MRYWWVSQNQTFEHEVSGGYLWSPKTNRDASTNHFYETMREVSCGDLIFSFNQRKIMAIGIAEGPAYTCPKPSEFGAAGAVWDEIGWRVDVSFKKLIHQIEPRAHMNVLRPTLPARYSPIRADGTGNQMYLAELPRLFAEALMRLIGPEAEVAQESAVQMLMHPDNQAGVADRKPEILQEWEKVQLEKIAHDESLPETERKQVSKARIGQGIFKQRVAGIESMCRVTRVDRIEHLIASHIKPWSVADNRERLDGENGFLLTPSIDHLFGRGYISFQDSGELIVSPVAHSQSLHRMGIPNTDGFNVGSFTDRQTDYLEYHRDVIFLKARA